jgi:hypothetical protein
VREIQEQLAPLLSGAPQKVWASPFGQDTQGMPLKRWEAMFRDWASEYWPSQPVRGTLQWLRDEFVGAARFVGRGFVKLPFGAIAGFFLILGMVNSDWAVGQLQQTRISHDGWGMQQQYTQLYARGFDGFDSLTQFEQIRVENYWVLVAAGGILFLALFRPIFGARADLLAILLAVYGVVHVFFFFDTHLDSIVPDPNVRNLEYRAAPLIVGITFAVLLVSLIWVLLTRVVTHFQESPKADRHFLRSFYQSLLGLPPR